MAKRMTDTRLRQFEMMVRDQVAPLQTELSAIESRMRVQIRDEVAKDMGITAILEELRQADQRREAVIARLTEILGKPGYGNAAPSPANARDDSPFGQEVNRRMEAMVGPVKEARKFCADKIRAVWLIDAPEGMQDLLGDLTDEMNPLIEALQGLRQNLLTDGQ